MKNIYFNRKDSVLRNLEEKPKQKKKVNWDKIVYFLILGLIIFFIFRYAFTRVLYVSAPGHVLFKSLVVRVPEDITIDVFYKFEGDDVIKGDTLFSYYSYEDQKAAFEQSLSGDLTGILDDKDNSTWKEKEVYQLNKNIQLNLIEIKEKQELINFYNTEIDKLVNEVILEISPKSKMDSYKKEVEKLELEILALQDENKVFQALIAELNSMSSAAIIEKDATLTSNYSTLGNGPVLRYYLAPTAGTITRLYKSDYEVALKSESILNMHEKKDIYIKAFFNQEDLAYFKEGDEVTIIFPDGEKSTGHIKRFYFATYRMPEEFQKKYESTTRAIAVDIFPIENESEIKWKAFYKMNVTVRVNKW
ncbi:hypothetical protein [Parvicella tangerina]|uniref:HlyD family efflux transporter periplasmic adaptor subunit n=1 Tax=Parvicella tangerina TaxID=2829795 RepID=A0A916JNP2_9FLAO|nr:hypothetical protein [Parvicella tangerina]CAG5084170.1 hypothetical protein CRYO30217_02396 [Parvicella tangerina]